MCAIWRRDDRNDPCSCACLERNATELFAAHRTGSHRVLGFWTIGQRFEQATDLYERFERCTSAFTLYARRGWPSPHPGTQFGTPYCIARRDRVKRTKRRPSNCPSIPNIRSPEGLHGRDNMTRPGSHRRESICDLPPALVRLQPEVVSAEYSPEAVRV